MKNWESILIHTFSFATLASAWFQVFWFRFPRIALEVWSRSSQCSLAAVQQEAEKGGAKPRDRHTTPEHWCWWDVSRRWLMPIYKIGLFTKLSMQLKGCLGNKRKCPCLLTPLSWHTVPSVPLCHNYGWALCSGLSQVALVQVFLAATAPVSPGGLCQGVGARGQGSS